MELRWKQVPHSTYSVSSDGQVRNDKTGRILKQQLRNGYPAVRLYIDGTHKLYMVHRLVAEAFIPNPNNLPFINHKSEIRTESFVDNLEWCSPEYNCNYGKRNEKIGKAQRKEVWVCTPSGEVILFDSCISASIWLGTTPESVSNSIRNKQTLYKNMIGYVSCDK